MMGCCIVSSAGVMYIKLMFKQALLLGRAVRAKDTSALYYTVVFSFDFLVGLAATIYSLYLLDHGLDLFQVNLVNTVFMLSSVVFEIPTGAYADYVGRKKSVCLSFAALPIGFGIYFFSSTIGWFMVAELFTAFAVACLSGALDAWVVDRLHQQGYSGKIDAVFSHGGMASGLALLFGGFFGAQLASIKLGLPFGVGALFALVVLLLVQWGMVEPNVNRQPTIFQLHTGVKRLTSVMQRSLQYGVKHPVVIWLLGAAVLANLAFQPLNMYWAPRILQLTQPGIWFLGYVWAGISVCLMVGAYLAKRLTQLRTSYRWLFVLATLLLALPIILVAATPVMTTLVSGFLIYEIGRGVLGPLHKSYLNQHIPSHERATLLSFDSLVSKVGAGIGLVAFGWLAKHYSIQLTWLMAGIVLLGLIPLYYHAVKQHNIVQSRRRPVNQRVSTLSRNDTSQPAG